MFVHILLTPILFFDGLDRCPGGFGLGNVFRLDGRIPVWSWKREAGDVAGLLGEVAKRPRFC